VSLTKQRKGIVIFASFVIAVGVLALIWLACWGVSFSLIKQGITYVDHPHGRAEPRCRNRQRGV